MTRGVGVLPERFFSSAATWGLGFSPRIHSHWAPAQHKPLIGERTAANRPPAASLDLLPLPPQRSSTRTATATPADTARSRSAAAWPSEWPPPHQTTGPRPM